MTPSRPVLHQIDLVVSDMDATLAFYPALGPAFDEHAGAVWPPGSGARHAEAVTAGGMLLEFDNAEMASLWHRGWREPGAGTATARVVIGFTVASREEVDQRYATLTAAGHPRRQEPYDAFRGGRYAVVADPDGNDCGLMGPDDPDRAYPPSRRGT